MDFEWQAFGPIDKSSPFHKHAMDLKKKRKSRWPFSSILSNINTGTHSQFESPLKTEVPSWNEPATKPWDFSKPSVASPEPSPFRTASFTTPRKPLDVDFSSGPETSPAEQADNEDTPESKPFEFTSGITKSSNKRNSLFGMYGRFAPSPGRVAKGYYENLERRLHKRRRRAQNFESQLVSARRASEDTSGDEVGALMPPLRQKRTFPKNQPYSQDWHSTENEGWLRATFTFLTTFPDAPAIIAKYLQIFFNFVIFGSIFYVVYSFYATIQADVNRASDEAMAEILSEMAQCSKNYIENQCGADARLPALETICSNWELCMNRDPAAVKRARLSAHTFAEILNSFVEPISLKTMAFASTVIILSIVVNNVTFTLYRRQYEQHHNQQPGSFGQYQSQSSYGQYPAIQTGKTSQLASPGYAQGNWHDNGTHDGNQRRLEYNTSPTKEHMARARSRSPEKWG
jgi:hypothetical protein